MRILVANDGLGDAGGVQSYLDAVVGGLLARSHDVAMLSLDAAPASPSGASGRARHFSVGRSGFDRAMADVRAWRPDICFSHNMRDLGVDRGLLEVAPVVKFMHGYLGTCVSGHKMFALPAARPCGRSFGAACAALYLPRRCGQFGLTRLVRQYGWAREQRGLHERYQALVVASEHMKGEFVSNGVDGARVHVNPLFSTQLPALAATAAPRADSVAFMGRMTMLKGGDVLVHAVRRASLDLGRAIPLTMIGDGPQRGDWERLAARLDVRANFVGWQTGDERWGWLQRSSLLAVPSVWPEPFGLVGLEAAAMGVPAIAFDVGGVREWLTPGENGFLVGGDRPRAEALAAGLVDAFRRPGELEAMRCRAMAAARRMSLARHLDRLEAIFRDSENSARR